jgi:hypothetical protein
VSRFLQNLAARTRGSIPRLEPRRPAPYEEFNDTASMHDSEVSEVSTDLPPRPAEPARPPRASAETPAPQTSISVDSPPIAVTHTPPATASVTEGDTNKAHASPPVAEPGRLMATPTQPTDTAARATPSISPPAPVTPTLNAPALAMRRMASVAKPGNSMTADTPAPSTAIAAPVTRLAGPASTATAETRATPAVSSPPLSPRSPARQRQQENSSHFQPSKVISENPSAADRPLPTHQPSVPATVTYQRPLYHAADRFRQTDIPAAEQTQPSTPPQVEVHIDNIEIVPQQATPQEAAGPAPVSRGISLDEFLDGSPSR